MKKIRNWLNKFRHKVTEEQLPPRYRDFTQEQWKQECARVREELHNLPETEDGSLDELLKFLEKHSEFFKTVDILRRRERQKNLHDIKYKI